MNKITICINDDTIQVLVRKREEYKIKNLQIPVGSLQNGKLINPIAIQDRLVEMKKEIHPFDGTVDVLLNASCVHIRNQRVPKMNRSQYVSLIKQDYPDEIYCQQGYLVDYYLRKTEKENWLLSYVVEKEVLQQYVRCFNAGGLRVRKISSYVQNVVEWVGNQSDLKNETFAFLNMEEQGNKISIFSKGNLIFHGSFIQEKLENRFSLIEIKRELFQIVDYLKNKGCLEIDTCYCYGMKHEDLKALIEGCVKQGIKIKSLFDVLEIEQISALRYQFLYKRNNINFLYANKKENHFYRKRGKTRVAAAVIISAIFLFVGIKISTDFIRMEMEIQNRREYIAYAKDHSIVTEFEELSTELQYYSDYLEGIQKIREQDKEVPSEVIRMVLNAEKQGVNLNSVEFVKENQKIVVKAYTTNSSNINRFMEKIEKNIVEGSIEYKGYSSGVDGIDRNQFEFTIHLKENLELDDTMEK